MAAYLIKSGFAKDSIAGVYVHRSFEMIIAILGILKAGGGLSSAGSNYPQERIGFMIEDSRTPCLITQSSLLDGLTARPEHILCLDIDWPAITADFPTVNPVCTAGPDDLAYVIYTSGSTGQPKGSLLRHKGLCNLVDVQRRAFDVDTSSRVLQFSSFSFDASVWEIFMALGNGAALVLAPYEVISSGPDLIALLAQQKVTHVTSSPSVLGVLDEASLPDLRVLVSAGEACPAELVARWAYGRRFFNAYGPTETTVCASMALCRAQDKFPPSIGTPISNARLFVLDAALEPLPVGIPGELYIGGVCVGRGYLNQPELTETKFIPDPFSTEPGARLYRTGDGARFRADGTLDFLGRLDDQVKLRGFRIELGEIEAALVDHPGIKQAVVVVHEDPPGQKRLAAYLVAEENRELPGRADLRCHLQSRLPEYMLPAFYVFLDALPLNPSGKVDRKKLPAPNEDSLAKRRTDRLLPRTLVEKQLAEIAQSLLGIDQIGLEDSFFELGGHSLLATQYISRIRSEFQVDLPLKTLFEQPTLLALAAYLEQRSPDRTYETDAIAQTLQMVEAMSEAELFKALEGESGLAIEDNE